MELSFTEENYLKAVFHLSHGGIETVTTNAIADLVQTKPASVSDMMKKLAKKLLVQRERYRGVRLTELGREQALMIIRKHRLWEVFLVDKLHFRWDEVHDIAEQLEHIQSSELINRLDKFLGYPRLDPHGDPIPDRQGHIASDVHVPLSSLEKDDCAVVGGVTDSDPALLQLLDKMNINLGNRIEVIDKVPFDGSLHVATGDRDKVFLSKKIADQLMMKKI